MRIFRVACMGLAGLVAMAGANAQTAGAQMPAVRGGAMLLCAGLPCVDVTVTGGKHLRMLIDTGDVSSVVDTKAAKAMGLALSPVMGGDGKPVAGYMRGVLAGARVGEGALGDVAVLVMDLSEMIAKDQMPAADGSLAYTAFKDRLLEMDYVGKRVRFSAVLTKPVERTGMSGELTTPTFGKKGPPILVGTGFTVNGKAVTAQIDSLFAGTMLIYPTSVEKLGLSLEAKTTKPRMFKYTDGGVEMLDGGPAEEEFGGQVLGSGSAVYFAGPEVHLPDGMFDATVGHELLERSVVELDLKGMRMWMR